MECSAGESARPRADRTATAHVSPAWLRVIGGDARTQFRAIIGWEVLGGEMFVYPRWQMQTPVSDFSHLV